jgi:hypothetical protein
LNINQLFRTPNSLLNKFDEACTVFLVFNHVMMVESHIFGT